mmetsp:Transcript_14674/g.28985  ORF Transcript_14674/g.28985 Transcript_14674/m.28985 type:complete len:214 (+) Transcript_14674:257-898(+)
MALKHLPEGFLGDAHVALVRLLDRLLALLLLCFCVVYCLLRRCFLLSFLACNLLSLRFAGESRLLGSLLLVLELLLVSNNARIMLVRRLDKAVDAVVLILLHLLGTLLVLSLHPPLLLTALRLLGVVRVFHVQGEVTPALHVEPSVVEVEYLFDGAFEELRKGLAAPPRVAVKDRRPGSKEVIEILGGLIRRQRVVNVSPRVLGVVRTPLLHV